MLVLLANTCGKYKRYTIYRAFALKVKNKEFLNFNKVLITAVGEHIMA